MDKFNSLELKLFKELRQQTISLDKIKIANGIKLSVDDRATRIQTFDELRDAVNENKGLIQAMSPKARKGMFGKFGFGQKKIKEETDQDVKGEVDDEAERMKAEKIAKIEEERRSSIGIVEKEVLENAKGGTKETLLPVAMDTALSPRHALAPIAPRDDLTSPSSASSHGGGKKARDRKLDEVIAKQAAMEKKLDIIMEKLGEIVAK